MTPFDCGDWRTMLSDVRVCLNCAENLPEGSHGSRRFCNNTCRSQFNRRAVAGSGLTTMREARNLAKKLAFQNMQDEVREVLREEIRKAITQHVRDNVLGAAEAMTGLLPEAIGALAVDIQDPDPIFRQRATNLILKYTMGFADKGEDGEDARIIQIIHGVPIPEGPLGEAMAETVDAIYEEAAVQTDWERCYVCHEEKHPQAGIEDARGFMCRACQIRKKLNQPGDNWQLGDK